VTPGTLYYYKVNADNASGYSGYSNTASATASSPIPAAPSNATATPSGTGINVTWTDNSTNENYFHIWRSTDNLNWVIVRNNVANTTSWLDNTVTGGQLYYYRIHASNANGSSGYSNVVSATAPVTLPAAPTNLVATPGTSNIVLTWTDSSSDEQGFRIYRSTDNATWGSIYGTVGAGVTTFTDAAPGAGVAYFYKVHSYNASGNSTASAGIACPVATVIARDGFNYTVGSGSTINGQNTGTGLGGNWTISKTSDASILAGSLTYSANGHALTTSGNRLQIRNWNNATATLAQNLGTDGTTVWVGFEFNAFNTNTGQVLNTSLGINPSAGSGTGIMFGAPFSAQIGARVTIGAYDGFLSTGISLVQNQTYFIVAKIQYLSTGDVISLYVNPTPGVTPTTPTASLTLPTSVAVPVSNQLILRSPQATNATYDEIRIGASYAAVAPDPLVPFTPAVALDAEASFINLSARPTIRLSTPSVDPAPAPTATAVRPTGLAVTTADSLRTGGVDWSPTLPTADYHFVPEPAPSDAEADAEVDPEVEEVPAP
jgi:hypothetical protein